MQWRAVADQICPKVPKLAAIMDEAEHDVLAHMTFPKEHRTKLHSINPIERFNGEIKRRGVAVTVTVFESHEMLLSPRRIARVQWPARHDVRRPVIKCVPGKLSIFIDAYLLFEVLLNLEELIAERAVDRLLRDPSAIIW